MQVLENKTILLISPDGWGKMHISKHHYAIELARLGNTVYFLNPFPPQATFRKKIEIRPTLHANLFCIDHQLPFPYQLRFHFLKGFHFLIRFYLKSLQKKIGKPIDIVWSFDLNYLYPFSHFSSRIIKIFHPVDEPRNEVAIQSAREADVLFSVTEEILEKYRAYSSPKFFINHGMSEAFLSSNSSRVENMNGIRVGFSGNMLRKDLDRDTFLTIIKENTEVTFECWGSYNLNDANIGGTEDADTRDFINRLREMPNLKLHGAVNTESLAKGYHLMDAFLICYDIQKDPSRGTNYHKVLEFLATGKIVISNNITTYKDEPDLVQMTMERNTNKQLPALFKKIIRDLARYNSEDLMQKRILFSRKNTYRNQISRIDNILQSIVNNKVQKS